MLEAVINITCNGFNNLSKTGDEHNERFVQSWSDKTSNLFDFDKLLLFTFSLV